MSHLISRTAGIEVLIEVVEATEIEALPVIAIADTKRNAMARIKR